MLLASAVAVRAQNRADASHPHETRVTIDDWARQPTTEAAARWGVPPEFNQAATSAITPAWARRLRGYLPARDGTRLRYSVLLPAGAGPFPVILNYSGYDPGAIGGSAYLQEDTAMSTSLDRSLLERGYAVLGVNARGTGCSEGVFDFLGPDYGRDGADIVEWAAAQHWSSGAVGMANWSWAGMSQLATASERPAHLKAIAPGMAMSDPRADSWAIGGVPSEGFITSWWMYLHSRWLTVRASAEAEHDTRCLQRIEHNYAAGQTPAINLPSQIIRHPLRDAWIAKRVILNQTDRITVPVLSLEAFQDEATTARAGYYQERLNPARLWYVQTNGEHDLYESLRFRQTLLDFLDHFVKGVRNGFETQAHVEVWQETTSTPGVTGNALDEQAQPSWVIRREHYPIAVQLLTLNMAPGHTLSPEAPSDNAMVADTYQYPVPGPDVNVDPDAPAWGPLATGALQGSVAYTTAPLPRDLVIYGPASADLWVSSTLSNADLQVTLTEVRADGLERFVQRGWLRLSDRALDPTHSTATRPWLCDLPACIQALPPGQPVLGRVELTKVSYAFRAGSRLRLWIDTPSATGGNQFDHASIPGTNTLWSDAAHRSRLVLGTLPDIEVPKAVEPCARVLMQPCRADPLAGSNAP